MPRIDPNLLSVLTDMERGLRELEVPFAVVGALVPELLLDVRPRRMTNDADVVVAVESMAAYDTLKQRLSDFGFAPMRVPHRLRHRDGGLLDILPFSEAIAPNGWLRLQDGITLNMAGFARVVASATPIPVDGGPTLPVTPLPLYALLKLVAYSDRRAPKDLASVLHCLEHCLDEDARRYAVEHDGEGVPYECTCAYLLGIDAHPFIDDAIRQTVTTVLGCLDSPDASVLALVARESGWTLDDDERSVIFERFRWFGLGMGE
jgi:predicted nucleotidyltransferase